MQQKYFYIGRKYIDLILVSFEQKLHSKVLSKKKLYKIKTNTISKSVIYASMAVTAFHTKYSSPDEIIESESFVARPFANKNYKCQHLPIVVHKSVINHFVAISPRGGVL